MSRIDSHVAAAQRKIMLGSFIDWLAVAGFVLAVLSLLTILLQRALHFGLPRQTLWIGLALVVVTALVLTILQRPSRESAAVAIDEKLSLKEKFSTALVVRGATDPFSQAVVRDAENTAQRVTLAGQFPVSFPRVGFATVGMAILALLAFQFMPTLDLLGREQKAQAKLTEERKIADTKERVRETLTKLESMPRAISDNESIRIAKAELSEILKHPMPDPGAASRRQMDALQKAEDALKQKADENKNFAQAKANTKMFKSMNLPIDAKGPVADAQRELVKGDYEEAIKDLKNAVDKFDKMSPKEKEEAAKQMAQLSQQLAAMAQDPRAAEKMADQLKQMGANQQQLQQAKDLIQRAAQGDKQAQQQLNQIQQQIAKQMNQGQGANQQQMQALQKAMQQAQQQANAQAQAGQMGQAAQQMAQAMQQAGQQGAQGQQGQQMAQGQQQMADMLQQMQGIQQDAQQMAAAQKELEDAMAQAGQQGQGGDGDGPLGPGETGEWKPGDPANKRGRGMGGPGQGMGGQGQKQAAAYSAKQEISKSFYDEKGKHLASIYVKDHSIRGEAKLQLGKIVQAGQADEGDDVDDSRSDRRTQEVQRRYFKVMEDEVRKTPG
jgi:hypothetical protein